MNAVLYRKPFLAQKRRLSYKTGTKQTTKEARRLHFVPTCADNDKISNMFVCADCDIVIIVTRYDRSKDKKTSRTEDKKFRRPED